MGPETVDILADNDKFQLLRAVKSNRNKRHRQGIFFIEGVKMVNAALEAGWPLEGAVCALGRPLSRWGQQVLARVPRLYRLAPALMEELSDREETSELLLLGRMCHLGAQAVPNHSRLLVLLDRPASPGNLGTIIRTADAFGADGLVVAGHGADPYDPQTVRASLGALFTLPVAQEDGPACLEAVRAARPGARLVGTSAKGERNISESGLAGPLVLLLGNETNGLSHAWRQACDELVRIPICGAASSLNLAAAASIFLYEAQRQRLAAGGRG